ncbi:MAG: hypothetical protein Q8880_08275 [Bacteroidota bacterium]|nr:hypothetical protein [Bacteroidota bacterium]
MKKSKLIKLVLLGVVFFSCHKEKKHDSNLYFRDDDKEEYTAMPYNGFGYYYWFIPYGFYNNNRYYHAGYYPNNMNNYSSSRYSRYSGMSRGNLITSSHESVSRGGFGRSSGVSS